MLTIDFITSDKHQLDELVSGLRVACARQPDATLLPLWLSLADGTLGFNDFAAHQGRQRQLSHISLDTTGSCDLRCPGMCYYHPEISRTRRPVSEPRLVAAVRSAAELFGLRVLVFAGKEPLLNGPRVFRLLEAFSEFRKGKFSIGLVSNGRNLLRYWPALRWAAERRELDFIDISLDSARAEQHDRIRGVPGTFDLAWAALERCNREELPGVRVGLSSVLRKDNAVEILELIQLANSKASHFYIVPMVPPVFTESEAPSWLEIRRFLENLRRLLTTELAGSNLEIMVSLLGLYLDDAACSGWIAWSQVREDRNGSFYVDHEFSGNRLGLQLLPLPETATRIARITYAGDYLPNTHFLQDATPARYAVGNLEDEELPVLYARALESGSIWQKILESRNAHTCKGRSCWTSCFGGWTVAEQSYLETKTLTDQPNLCRKTDADFILNR